MERVNGFQWWKRLYAKEQKIRRAQNVLETKSSSSLLKTVKLEVRGDDQISSQINNMGTA